MPTQPDVAPEVPMTPPWLAQFEPDPGYLNTATVGIPPRSAVQAMEAALAQWRHGRLEPSDFDEHVTRSRSAWARISGVDPARVATGSTVSSLVGLVAAGLPAGAQVLVAEGDFTSVLFPFLAQVSRGARVREVPLERLIESIDGSVDLVAVSAVQSADGRVVDIAALATAAATHDARILLDTTQSCGWLPIDVSAIDYTVCAAYKWLLCPRGVAFMAVRPDRLDAITPHAAGWYAGQDIWASIYGSPLRLAADTRRLDTSPAWFCWVGASEALELLASIDAGTIRQHDVGLADAFLADLGRPPQGSAIVTVDAGDTAERLAAAGIRTAHRAGRVRASFHLYNNRHDVDLAVRALTAGR